MSKTIWQRIYAKLDGFWRRFLALPWKLKAPALGLGVLCALAVVVLAVALGGDGGDGDLTGDSGARHGRSVYPRTSRRRRTDPTPPYAATGASTPAPTSPRRPANTPAPPGLRRWIPADTGTARATFERMLAFALIPGASNQAVVVTQGGRIYRLSLAGGAPSLYGDLSARVIAFTAENEGGLLGLAFSPNFEADHRVYLYFTSNDCAIAAARLRCPGLRRCPGDTINTGSES
jgi:hypothetical protein